LAKLKLFYNFLKSSKINKLLRNCLIFKYNFVKSYEQLKLQKKMTISNRK